MKVQTLIESRDQAEIRLLRRLLNDTWENLDELISDSSERNIAEPIIRRMVGVRDGIEFELRRIMR